MHNNNYKGDSFGDVTWPEVDIYRSTLIKITWLALPHHWVTVLHHQVIGQKASKFQRHHEQLGFHLDGAKLLRMVAIESFMWLQSI